MKIIVYTRRWLGNLLFKLYWMMLHLPMCRGMKERRVIKCFWHELTPSQKQFLRTQGRFGEPVPMGAIWDEGTEGSEWACVQTPGGIWYLDEVEVGRRGRERRVWIWRGTVEDGTLTVLSAIVRWRENGSIRFPGYHVRLYRSHLVQLLL